MRLRDENCSFCGNPEDVSLGFLEMLVCWGNLDMDTRSYYSYLSIKILPVVFPSRRHLIAATYLSAVSSSLQEGQSAFPVVKCWKEKGTKINKFSVLDYVAIQCSVHLIDLRKDRE